MREREKREAKKDPRNISTARLQTRKRDKESEKAEMLSGYISIANFFFFKYHNWTFSCTNLNNKNFAEFVVTVLKMSVPLFFFFACTVLDCAGRLTRKE